MKVYLNAFLYGQRLSGKTRFFIFGQGRTGSTLLVTMLDSHPEIHCEDELLFHPRLFPMGYIRGICGASTKPVVGFHVKIYQLLYDQKMPEPQVFLDRLREDDWKMIFLKREDIFRHAVSPILAQARNLWHVGKTGEALNPPTSVRLNPDQVVAAVRQRQTYRKMEAEIVSDFPHLEICYERDLFDSTQRQRTSGRLCEYLGVAKQNLTSPLKATTSRSLKDAIENFGEIEHAMRDAGMGACLEGLE